MEQFLYTGLNTNGNKIWSRGVACLMVLALFTPGVLSADNLATVRPNRDTSKHTLNDEKAEVVQGALGQDAWQLAPKNGRLAFTVRCDPEKQNYLTVRFWSEDRGNNIALADGDGKNLGNIDHKTSGNIAPAQWYYGTHLLPRELTEGKQTVSLQLKHNADQPSRGIYEIAGHTGARFQPGGRVPQTKVVEPYSFGSYEPPDKEEIDVEGWAAKKLEAADKTAKFIMSRQRYARDWREKVGSGKWDGVLVGGFRVRMKDTLQASKNATMKYIKKRDNGGPMRGVVILAKAYTLEGGKYKGAPAVLDRVAVGLDFMRRAQGKNGGFIDVHGGKWVGGPSRGTGEGVLEGRMHRAAATAFRLTCENLKKEGLLDERVDDDADPETPPVPRRKLLSDLFQNSLSYLIKGRGHAPNQELMNVNALAPLFRALQLLGAELKEKQLQEQMQQRIAEITGIKPVGRGTKNPYWVSPKGISMEIGGMSLANYGAGITGQLSRLAEVTENERVRRRTITTAEAKSQFWYPVYHADGRIDMREQEAWSRRGTNVRGGGMSSDVWAALQGVPSHIRAFQLQIMAGRKFGPHNPGEVNAITGYHPHGWNRSVGIVNGAKAAENYVKLFEKLRNTEGARLPHEKGQPDFAWVDPVAGAVAIKRGDHHVFMTLMSIDGADKPLAGVLEVSPRSQRRAVIAVETPHGLPDDLTLVEYGPFFIAVNASAENEYRITLPDNGRDRIKEMIAGRTLQAGSLLTLQPGDSIVLSVAKTPAGVRGRSGGGAVMRPANRESAVHLLVLRSIAPDGRGVGCICFYNC